MNPSTNNNQAPLAADDLAPPPQPHRLSTSCDIHPDEHFSGFCPSCLCERLSVLDHNVAPPSSSSRKPPTISAGTFKSLFKHSTVNTIANGRIQPGFFPELRRTKSFSAKNNSEGFASGVEPRRRSCDIRLRDDHKNLPTKEATVVSGGKIDEEARKSSVSEPVFEVNEEETEIEEVRENGGHSHIINDSIAEKSAEILEKVEEFKSMKDYIELYPQSKKPSVRDFAGSFWSAASVFSKKLHKWRQKQKIKKTKGRSELPVEKAIGRKFRDTQSDIADYGFARRSGDTDPRFSLDTGRFSVDIGRISLDDPRYSLDEPRASCDGYLIGRTAARVLPPPSMLSVVENAPVGQSDMKIPVEVLLSPSTSPINGESNSIINIPGGSNQTRDYYTEPPSRRRKSIDRSNSIRKTVGTEPDEVKQVSNLKASPAMSIDSSSRTVRNDYTKDKKSRRWGKWSILGFMYRKGIISKDDKEDMYSRSNSTGMVDRSLSESWPELRNGGGPRMKRSNSNVSWRSSGGGSAKNKSCRYSPKDGENGMLKFYLTPMRSSWRTGGSGGNGGGGGWEKTAAKANSHGHSIARRVMRLY